MNKFVKDTFDYIKKAEGDYRQSVTNALWEYRRTMAAAEKEAGQYKDEGGFIDSKRANAKEKARMEIQLAENGYTSVLQAQVKSLKDDLRQHLTTRPSAAFLDALRLYADFDLAPSRAEIVALMEQNGGCVLGLRALNRVLERTKSEWRIDAPAGSDYESDLSNLERMVHGHFVFSPDGYHHEAVEVFGGTPHLRMRDDGTFYDAGYRWDNTSILTATVNYKSDVAALDGMAERWSSTVLPSLKHISAYTDNEDTGETAAQQMVKDIKATATAPEIKKDGQAEVEAARQRAAKQAEVDAKAAAGMEKYML